MLLPLLACSLPRARLSNRRSSDSVVSVENGSTRAPENRSRLKISFFEILTLYLAISWDMLISSDFETVDFLVPRFAILKGSFDGVD